MLQKNYNFFYQESSEMPPFRWGDRFEILGLKNSSNQNFITNVDITNSNDFFIFHNGIVLNQNGDYLFQPKTNIRLITIYPAPTDILFGFKGQPNMRFEITGLLNGTNRLFYSGVNLESSNDFFVFYNGSCLDKESDYTFTTPNKIYFDSFIPGPGDKIWGMKFIT